MTALITADLHITDRVADEYRWPIFKWLGDQAKEFNVEEILILGDLTDSKDRHSSKLVNRLFHELVNVSVYAKLFLLKGNHDYVDPANPFFKFVSTQPTIEYLSEPAYTELSIGKATFIPAGANWNFKVHQFPFLFTHVTFDGSEAENGRLLPGVDPGVLADYEGKCYSGDIHVPQKIRKNIEYVGAPYHIRFGDIYEPRVLLIRDNGKTQDLHFPAPRKHVVAIQTLAELEKLKIPASDQVKIRCYLRRSEYDKWRELKEGVKQTAEGKGWLLSGTELLPLATNATENKIDDSRVLSTVELVRSYARRQKADDDYTAFGEALISKGS